MPNQDRSRYTGVKYPLVSVARTGKDSVTLCNLYLPNRYGGTIKRVIFHMYWVT